MAGGRIVEVVETDDDGSPDHRDGEVVLPLGAVLGGGFVDDHLHLAATAAARRSIDLSTARSVAEVCERVADAAARQAPGRWLRAWGIDETDLAERRLPTTDELDRAAGGRPLVVHHRTGHAQLRSTAARAGDGPPPLPFEELQDAAAALGAELAAAGVVAVTDATHTNDRAALDLLDRLALPQRVTAMIGAEHLAGLEPGGRYGAVTVGPAKIMPPSCGHDRVAALIERAHAAGFAAAVHAVDIDELQVALDGGLGPGDRVEHLGLCLPEQLVELAARRLTVVTQPSFLTYRATKYRAELSEIEQAWLYRLRSLLAAGLDVRGSSDAPVVPARPLEGIAAACGRTLGPDERIDVESAYALFGRPVAVGGPADLVVLDADPVRVAAGGGPAQLAELAVLAVWRDGRLLHGDPRRWPSAP